MIQSKNENTDRQTDLKFEILIQINSRGNSKNLQDYLRSCLKSEDADLIILVTSVLDDSPTPKNIQYCAICTSSRKIRKLATLQFECNNLFKFHSLFQYKRGKLHSKMSPYHKVWIIKLAMMISISITKVLKNQFLIIYLLTRVPFISKSQKIMGTPVGAPILDLKNRGCLAPMAPTLMRPLIFIGKT